MTMTQRPLVFLFVLALGCGTSDEDGDGGLADGGDGGLVGTDGGAGKDGGAAIQYTAVMIVDKDTDGAQCNTTGPGADIDGVELRSSAGVVVGTGMKGTASFAMGGGGTTCTDAQCPGGKCKYSDPALIRNIEGPRDAMVHQSTNDVGYFSLNGNRVQMQIGSASGDGPAMTITSGMQIKVREVDQSYKADGSAYPGCICAPERYEVYLLENPGSNVNAKKLNVSMFDAANQTVCATMAMQVGGSEGCGSSVFTVP